MALARLRVREYARGGGDKPGAGAALNSVRLARARVEASPWRTHALNAPELGGASLVVGERRDYLATRTLFSPDLDPLDEAELLQLLRDGDDVPGVGCARLALAHHHGVL